MEVYRGDSIKARWSSHIIITGILLTLRTARWTFYGVITENRDPYPWDWPDLDGLLWVFHNGEHVKAWEEAHQRPRVSDGELEGILEDILGFWETAKGSVYCAVKWVGYECPTWELEQDLQQCSNLSERLGAAPVLTTKYI